VINLDNLKVLSKNNPAFIKEILEVYLENAPLDFNKLKDHAAKEDWTMVRYYAHKLKSSSFTIGFDDGYSAFQSIERIIKNQEGVSPIPELINTADRLCQNSFSEVKDALKNY
jgi:HPt (histidine-containing phosphotransfer) domain-containing protein